MFLTTALLVGFSITVGVGHLISKLTKPFMSSLGIKKQLQNLNHSLKFRQKLSELATKLESNIYDTKDKELLTYLEKCKFSSEEKSLLKNYLAQKLEDENTEQKGTFRIALQYVENQEYLPSWKLVSRLKNELPKEPNQSKLQKSIDRIHQVYIDKLSLYT